MRAVASRELPARLVDRRLDLEQARLARRAAGREVGAHQVAVERDRGEVGQVRDEGACGVEVVDHGDLEQQPGQRGAELVGASTTSSGVRRAGRAGRASRGSCRGAAAQEQSGTAEVVGLEVRDGVDGGVGTGDDDGVGGRAERRGDGGLVARAHGQQRGHRAEQPGDPVGGGQQRARTVLAVEADLERVLAGHEPGPVAVGLLGLLASLGEPLVDVVEGRDGGLVLGVEPLLAGVEPGDLGLERGEVRWARSARATASSRAAGEPADLLVGGGRPRLRGR